MTDKVKFLMLCWRAYNGDVKAAVEVAVILRNKTRRIFN